MFTYANNTGVLLNPHATGYDAAKAGAITGTLTLTQVSNDTSASGRVKIQVTAETLSADGLHHIVVTSAPVRSDGTFALYPLATTSSASNSSSSSSSSGSSGSSNSSGSASSNASSATGSSSMSSSATSSLANNSSSASSSSGGTPYDVVIHGPTIATIIIRDIRVVAGDPSTTTPVSIGTLTPRQATSYSVDVTPTSTATLPAGTLVGFYQTLPGAGEKPYVIEEMPIDPFNRTLATPTPLSQATIDLGTYHSSGSTITVTGSTPVEGAGGYRVAGTAPLFSDEDVTINPVHVSAPSSTTTAPVQVTVPPPAFASGSVADSITATVAQAAPGTYNQGEIIVSHDGAVVATAPLDSILTQPGGGTVVLTGVPGGTSTAAFASALYYLSVRVWNSSNPGGTVHRQSYDMPVDLRNGSASGIVIAIN